MFGWETDDSETGGGAVYTTFCIAGDAVCELFEMPGERAGLEGLVGSDSSGGDSLARR
ncbi:MAG: hypothetical protein ACRDK0_00800 [Solirubrobacteraceae bacterium]